MSKARDLANAGTALTTVSATELGYLDGVTSAVQTQIDSKIGQATAINPTIVDAKGDIIAATAADTVSRLAVGANDTVLTADSSTATGLKWATPATGTTYVGCAAYRDTNLSVTKNTNTLLTLPSEQYDTDGFHSTSTNTGRFTVPAGKAGKYQINCAVSWNSSITEQAWLMLYINGSQVNANGLSLGRFQEFPGTANTDFISGSTSYSFSVGDYAEIYVFHNGTNTPLNVDSARVTFDYLGA